MGGSQSSKEQTDPPPGIHCMGGGSMVTLDFPLNLPMLTTHKESSMVWPAVSQEMLCCNLKSHKESTATTRGAENPPVCCDL